MTQKFEQNEFYELYSDSKKTSLLIFTHENKTNVIGYVLPTYVLFQNVVLMSRYLPLAGSTYLQYSNIVTEQLVDLASTINFLENRIHSAIYSKN